MVVRTHTFHLSHSTNGHLHAVCSAAHRKKSFDRPRATCPTSTTYNFELSCGKHREQRKPGRRDAFIHSRHSLFIYGHLPASEASKNALSCVHLFVLYFLLLISQLCHHFTKKAVNGHERQDWGTSARWPQKFTAPARGPRRSRAFEPPRRSRCSCRSRRVLR